MLRRIFAVLAGCLFLVIASTTYAQSPTRMYWADEGTNKIQRALLNGSTVEDVVTGLGKPKGIAVDFINSPNMVYWTDDGTKKIQRAPLAGGTVEDLVTGLNKPRGIALDLVNNKMYWADEGTNKIQRASLAGGTVEDVVTGLSKPRGIALDVTGGKIYWTDDGTKKIQRAPLAGGTVEDVVTGLGSPKGIAVDAAGEKIYWTDDSKNTEKIQRAPLAGGTVEDLVTGLDKPRGIDLDYNEGSIPVELSSFTAMAGDGKVTLNWITQTETENLGFYIYRTMAEDGEYAKLSQELIQGAGSSDQAHSYSYTDQDVEAGNTYYYKLTDVDFNGNINFHGPISVTVEKVTPKKYVLEQSYPNPFNPETAINFSIKQTGKVSLKIYNVQGQLIRSLVDADKLAGSYSVIWNGTNDQGTRVSSGTYLYTLKVNGFEETKKLVFMK